MSQVRGQRFQSFLGGGKAGLFLLGLFLLSGLVFVQLGCATASSPSLAGAETPEMPKSQESEAGNGVSEASEAPEASREKLSNTLNWSTASEVENFGFDVYRGPEEEGPFERMTKKPIPGAGTTDLPSKYSFEDDTIESGKVYWYYVESISLSGDREHFTPVFQAKVKTYEDEK